jgi:hypothetical protein
MKKLKEFIIKRNKNEIDLYYNIRYFFIKKENPKTESKFLLMEMYSNILINMIFLKCRYQKKTEKVIISFIEKYKTNIKNIYKINNINNKLINS